VAGNVRELLNLVEQLTWLSHDGVVELQHPPVSMRTGGATWCPGS
jgi:transcriptional regulator of acetoin/glycerol metabolism